MLISLIILLILSSLVLIKSADLIIISVRQLSRGTKSNVFFLSAILVALGTSLPELSVGITSSLRGSSHLSLGNVLGANIANMSLVAGLAALIAGGVSVHGNQVKKEILIAFLTSLLPVILLIDGSLNRIDGLVLIAAYLLYTLSFFKIHTNRLSQDHERGAFIHRFMREFKHFESTKSKELLRFIIGIVLLIISSGVIVKIAENVAQLAHVPIFLIGLILVSLGTTLPELVFSLEAIRDHEPNMFFGNLLGSIIGNSTLIIGIASVISPINMNLSRENLFALGVFAVIFLLFWFFIRVKSRLERWEAGVLVLIYIVFIIIEFGGLR